MQVYVFIITYKAHNNNQKQNSMKAYKVIHQNGLFFNTENGKRLIFKEQFQYLINAEDNAFEEVDILNVEPAKIRNSNEMFEFVNANYRNADTRKIFDRGALFVFRIGLGRKREGDDGKEYFFLCHTLEDLYAYKKKESSFPRLCQCNCEVVECLSSNLKHFEPVYADSLNKVASNTISHFFSLKRAAALNVLIEFKLVNSLNKLKENLYSDYIKHLPPLEQFIKSVFK